MPLGAAQPTLRARGRTDMSTEQPPHSGRSNRARRLCRARVLALDSAADIMYELQRMGVSSALEPTARTRLVKLDAVSASTAQALSRQMADCGGEAAISQRAAPGAKQATDCLLIGSIASYSRLLERLRDDQGGLRQAVDEIARALNAFEVPLTGELRCAARTLRLGARTLVMGVVNATPDSFSGDGLAGDVGAMVALGEEMTAQGADVIDVGGESTRPGSRAVDAQEEIARVAPVVAELSKRINIPISIDTYKTQVARAALDAGAAMINDISALRADAGMAALAASACVPVIVMHMQGTPKTMQQAPRYDDLMGEIAAHLRESVDLAARAGVARDQVVIDPGFGFGKTVNHNLEIVRRLRELKSLGQPVLLGPSRKSTIGRVLDLPAQERLEGTLSVLALAVANGADMVRVHDVAAAVRAARMAEAVVRGWRGD